MDHDYPRHIKTYWSEEYACVFCGSTTNTGHVPSCRNANLYDWQGNAIEASPLVVERPTWYKLSVLLKTSDEIRTGWLSARFNHDLACALNKVFADHGVSASLFSRIELISVKAEDVQS